MIKTGFAWILLTVGIEGMLFAIVMLVKNQNTYKKHNVIMNAISKWGLRNPSISSEDFKEMYDAMEEYSSTLFRLTDWGHEHILPADKYEKIKPFIC